jgi:hypothetical protein
VFANLQPDDGAATTSYLLEVRCDIFLCVLLIAHWVTHTWYSKPAVDEVVGLKDC